MAKLCIVNGCSSQGDLFSAPECKRKLKVWQQILQTDADKFLICSIHFETRFVGNEKFLTQNAFPSILINSNQEYKNTESCQACLHIFEAAEQKHSIQQSIRDIFRKGTGFHLNDGWICATCHQQLADYDFFITDLKIKHEILQSHLGQKKRQESAAKKKKRDTLDPLKSLQPNENTPYESSEPHLSEQFDESYEDNDVIVLPTEKPQVYEIPDDEDDEDDEETDSSEENLDASENLVVAIDPDAMYENKDSFYHGFPAHFLDFEEGLSPQRRVREVSCSICHKIFPSIVGLKIHEKKMHKKGAGTPISPLAVQPLPTLTVKEAFASPRPSSVQCSTCGVFFRSYYRMQKHRDLEHPSEGSLKCRFPYCRTRGSTLEEINAHYSKFHEGVTPPPSKKRKRKSKTMDEDSSEEQSLTFQEPSPHHIAS